MIRLFIGFDPRETVCFHVLSSSIQKCSSRPVSITPLALAQLKDVLTRKRHPLQSTDFSFSRFLVPCLSGFEGWSLFTDCDMLARKDLATLWELRDERFAVMVVKHDYQPREKTKFLNQPQTTYQKKNWSSVMLFNNARCQALQPEYVNSASGLDLHQFKWLPDENEIGELPVIWNHLVGVYDWRPDAGLVHFTEGAPCFAPYAGSDYADEWRECRDTMLDCSETGTSSS